MKLPLIALAALLAGAHAAPVLQDSAVAPRKGNWQNKDNEAVYRFTEDGPFSYPGNRDDNKVIKQQAAEVGQFSDDFLQFLDALRNYYFEKAGKKTKIPKKKRVTKTCPITVPDKKTLLKSVLDKKTTKKPAPIQKKASKEVDVKKPASVRKNAPEEVPVKKPAPAQKEKKAPEADTSTQKDTSAKKDSTPAQEDASKKDNSPKKDSAP